ncbi:MAG: DUF4255 domain-containing protein [Solirubrobacteraceae bacterium]
MSNHAAIAAVTATLTNMIQGAVAVDSAVSSGTVTARPPDRARQGGIGNQINLFLYRTSIDPAWRNQDPPSIKPGETGPPPLPLVLSYLITAYGENDDEILAHRLLGIAMGVLNDKPLLSRAQIATALAAPGSDLENQVERVRITPDPRPQDEISRMWATFGTGYRLSVSYDAAVVLIDGQNTVLAPPPVLTRGRGDTGPVVSAMLPEIGAVLPPNRQPAAQPGDVLTVTGSNLDQTHDVQLSHPLGVGPIALTPTSITTTAVTVQLPDPPTLPAGVATVAVRFSALMDKPPAADDPPILVPSNAVPVALAPRLDIAAPINVKLAKRGPTKLTVNCTPPVKPTQTIGLIVGTRLVTEPPVSADSSELTFELEDFTPGTYMLRLRIDAIDSIPLAPGPAAANPDQPVPMQFDPNHQVVLS